MGDLDSVSLQSGPSVADERDGREMGGWMGVDRGVYRRMIRLRTVSHTIGRISPDSRSRASLVSPSNQARGYKLIYPD